MRVRRVAILDADTCDLCRALDGLVLDTDYALDVSLRIPPGGCDHEAEGQETIGCRCITVRMEGKLAAWWRRWSFRGGHS